MLNNNMWNIFKKTGNIEAYLYYRQYKKMLEFKENQLLGSQIQMIETTKTSSV